MKKNKWYMYVIAFCLPFLLMLIAYACNGIYPYGEKSVLTIDMAGQYVSFFDSLHDLLHGVIGPFYSFSKTLGGNMYSLITYYLFSPFNFIIYFFSKENITEAIFLINLLKIGSCGLTSYIYLHKTFNKSDAFTLLFSFCYALIGYNLVYSQNIMWLDGVIWLPIIFLGIDKLVTKQKPLLFFTSLTIAIISNYYIGYMLCIGSLLYFLYKLYIFNNYSLKLKKDKKMIIYFFKFALLAVGVSMVILLPSALSLLGGKTENFTSDIFPKQLYAIFDLVTKFYIGTSDIKTVFGAPNVYISLFLFILAILYFFNKKISLKERKASFTILCIFLISFIIFPLDLIWHLFQKPIMFSFRYSFIFSFILLIFAYKNFINLDKEDKKIYKNLFLFFIIASLIIDKVLWTSNLYHKIVMNVLFIVFYFYFLYYKRGNKNLEKLLILVVMAEITINAVLTLNVFSYKTKDSYVTFYNDYNSIIEKIKKEDSSFYRIEKNISYSTNDELMLNYSGISHFSSTYEGQNNRLLGDYLGIFNRFYVTNYLGSTPLTNSLFNIKYVILDEENKLYNLKEQTSELFVYENLYNLPLGFMTNNNILDLELEKDDPFYNQNNIFKKLTGSSENIFSSLTIEDLVLDNVKVTETNKDKKYTKIYEDERGSVTYYTTAPKNGSIYAYIGSDYNKAVDVLLNGKSIIDTESENGYMYNILDLGYFQAGEKIELTFVLLDTSVRIKSNEFALFNEEVFKVGIAKLQQSSRLNLEEVETDYLKGNVLVKEKGILYTSIPYDKGWTIKVDGEEVSFVKIFDSLIGIELETGNHTIEFSYTPRGFKLGLGISIISLLILILTKKKVS